MKKASKKSAKESFKLFHSIMKASVSGNPKSKARSVKPKKKKSD